MLHLLPLRIRPIVAHEKDVQLEGREEAPRTRHYASAEADYILEGAGVVEIDGCEFRNTVYAAPE